MKKILQAAGLASVGAAVLSTPTLAEGVVTALFTAPAAGAP